MDLLSKHNDFIVGIAHIYANFPEGNEHRQIVSTNAMKFYSMHHFDAWFLTNNAK